MNNEVSFFLVISFKIKLIIEFFKVDYCVTTTFYLTTWENFEKLLLKLDETYGNDFGLIKISRKIHPDRSEKIFTINFFSVSNFEISNRKEKGNDF